jgi:4-alpha-glucanotransferase
MARPPARPALRALADRLGILADYVSLTGAVVETTDDTRLALLAAMGVDAATEDAAALACAELERAAAARVLAPVGVVRAPDLDLHRVALTPPPALGAPHGWSVDLVEEGGTVHRAQGRLAPDVAPGRLEVALPAAPPPGYHRLVATLTGAGWERTAVQHLIVTPARCPTPADRLGDRRVFGLTANLYSVRSARNWGVGDVGDLAALVDWCATIGAAFLGVNPLHALRNAGAAISPYSPVTRLFRNVIYLDVPALPELAESSVARTLAADAERAAAALRAGAHVDYERVASLKLGVLRALHRTFLADHAERDTPRGRAYRAYRAEQGGALDDFATFGALETVLAAEGRAPGSWRDWPAAYRRPRAAAVAAFRAAHADEVDFHRYLQFALDAQLAEVAARARRRGLPIGLYQDLAIGSSGDGSDPWAFPGLFLDGASVGAPPDDYSPTGQDWGLPAMDPRRLEADGYRYWIRLLRNALAHAGALRIDHVMGLLRQYWVPAGRPGTEGAYVRFPAEDLFGILALEATRAGALVVGEDIGTVPDGFARLLARWGVLSSRVLYFERAGGGGFRPLADYGTRALVTVNTHDLAPLAGWWIDRDLELRRAAGFLASDDELVTARGQRADERRGLLRRLVADGALADAAEPPAAAVLRAAVHRFLCRTPAPLVGVALDDLVGETEPVNLPGVGLERFPSWSRRMRMPLEALPTDPDVCTALAGTEERAVGEEGA